MTPQSFITVVVPFAAGRSPAVEEEVKNLTDPALGNFPSPDIRARLDQVGTVHFASIVVAVPECPAERRRSRRGEDIPNSEVAHLVIEITADGTVDAALRQISIALEEVLTHLLDVAGIGNARGSVFDVLSKHHHVIGPSWFAALGQTFSGSPAMTVRRILGERDLAARIAPFLHGLEGSAWAQRDDPRTVLNRVKAELRNDPELGWAFVPEQARCLQGIPKIDLGLYLRSFLSGVGVLLWPLGLPCLAVLILATLMSIKDGVGAALALDVTIATGLLAFASLSFGLAYWRFRFLETTESVEDQQPDATHVEELMTRENYFHQNHLASVSRLKRSPLRALALRLAFFVVGQGRSFCAPGFLGRNGVIHSARWIRLRGSRQLLFLSNYDDTWESYVADFIAEAPTGVTAIWSNCVGFPRATRLFEGGAKDRDRLMRWARRQQIPTLFWYSAYPNLTAARIRVNAAIRQGLTTDLTDADVADWLSCFGSAPRTAATLATTEIPTLAFGGLSSLRFSRCHILTFSTTPRAGWLELLNPSFGEYERKAEGLPATVIAFSASGLLRLGLSQDALSTFPVAFQHGMAPDWRARALGDLGRNSPVHWEWGGRNKPSTDALVILYANSASQLDFVDQECRAIFQRFDVQISNSIELEELPERLSDRGTAPPSLAALIREPFGFADGVSQPVIRRHSGTPRGIHSVAPGELILGYPDNLNTIPVPPTVAAAEDDKHLLPEAGSDPFRLRPYFAEYNATGRRDIGTNGTFLVVRQLAQDVERFNERLAQAARQFPQNLVPQACAHDPERLKEWISSKMVGRWPNGSSLIRHPHRPAVAGEHPVEPDNDFYYGLEDPDGLKCPLGAHIRRANPRDTLCPSPHIRGDAPRGDPVPPADEQIDISNRHRILRVGRPYHSGNASKSGLLFMCINADIERQFEFIQKSWLLNPSFHGLQNESDALLAENSETSFFTIPTQAGGVRVPTLESVVTAVGGGYFFLPSRRVFRYLASSAERRSAVHG